MGDGRGDPDGGERPGPAVVRPEEDGVSEESGAGSSVPSESVDGASESDGGKRGKTR